MKIQRVEIEKDKEDTKHKLGEIYQYQSIPYLVIRLPNGSYTFLNVYTSQVMPDSHDSLTELDTFYTRTNHVRSILSLSLTE